MRGCWHVLSCCPKCFADQVPQLVKHIWSLLFHFGTLPRGSSFSLENSISKEILICGEVCYVHPASYASTLDDAPQVRCYGHGWSTTVGAEDMMKCSRNPSQGGDVAGVGLLLVVCPALMLPVNPSADPVPQLPKRV